MGSDSADFRQAFSETGKKSFLDLSPSEQSKVASRAQVLKVARNGLPPPSDLHDAAAQIRQQSKSIFEKLDALTKGQDMTFSDWQQQERGAFRRGDLAAAHEAKAEQQAILDQFKSQFDPTDLENARTNWRQASALDDIHDSLNSKSVVQPTPIELRPTGTSDPGYINGRNFSKEILQLANDGTLKQAGLTPEHIQSLHDLGTLLEKSSVGKPDLLMKAFKAAKVMTGAATAGGGYLASAGLGRLMTNPETAAKVLKFAQAAAKVGPGAAANIYRGASDSLGGINNHP